MGEGVGVLIKNFERMSDAVNAGLHQADTDRMFEWEDVLQFLWCGVHEQDAERIFDAVNAGVGTVNVRVLKGFTIMLSAHPPFSLTLAQVELLTSAPLSCPISLDAPPRCPQSA